jgi:hypothetical protein
MTTRTACAVRPHRLLLAAGVLAAACGEISDAEQLRPQAARADSAGVTILTSDAPRWRAGTADAWTIAPEPDLQMGTVVLLLLGLTACGEPAPDLSWLGQGLDSSAPPRHPDTKRQNGTPL